IRDCKNIAYQYMFLCCWRALLRLHAMLRRNVAATAAASNSHALVCVFVCSTRRLRATLPALRPAVLLSSEFSSCTKASKPMCKVLWVQQMGNLVYGLIKWVSQIDLQQFLHN
ncbi:unnamed protein product, partial [Trichogramma brassicae]